MTSRRKFLLLTALVCGAVAIVCSAQSSAGASSQPNEAASIAAFQAMLPVLHHPRCINCHSSGDYPRQGDDSHVHSMDARRGPGGEGVNGVMCSTCHLDHNLPGRHMPPGSPEWALPPADTPMVWEGLTDHQLCELLKNPQQNGHRSGAQIIHHLSTPLVQWGWNPGEGRTPVPMPKEKFLSLANQWVSGGAACPPAQTARVH